MSSLNWAKLLRAKNRDVNREEITIFDSTGMALQDVAWQRHWLLRKHNI
jgi:ornithine cyclodeaminase/alanine dehydrogenase-like protein (mu-crystallin family)